MNEFITSFFKQYQEIAETGKGISGETIKVLESKLNVRLPKSYINFLSQYGYADLFGRSIFGYEPPEDTTVVVHTNDWLEKGLLKGCVVIADSHEFIYCLNTNEMNSNLECPVVCYHPFGQSFYRVDFSSFQVFLEEIIKEGLDNIT